MHGLEHFQRKGLAGFAKTGGRGAGNFQSLLVSPALNSGNSSFAGAVLTGDLFQEGPKNERMGIVPDPFGSAMLFEKFRADFVTE